jgi:hypothetical protein
MLGRFLLVGMSASMAQFAVAAAPTVSGVDAERPAELRLSCIGAMHTKDIPPPGSRVMADGLIDFAGRRVQGFGLGGQPILVLTASNVRFGSSPQVDPAGGNIVEGWIDRASGRTRIIVRSPRTPSDIEIEMTLDCKFEEPVS